MPKTLDETYDRILRNIPDGYRSYAIRILQFLTYSKRPMYRREVIDAVAVDLDQDEYFNPKNRMPDPQEITYYCSSLVVAALANDTTFEDDAASEDHTASDD